LQSNRLVWNYPQIFNPLRKLLAGGTRALKGPMFWKNDKGLDGRTYNFFVRWCVARPG
jgi:hypothetical protein